MNHITPLLEPKLLALANDWRWRGRKPTPEEAKELADLLWRWSEVELSEKS